MFETKFRSYMQKSYPRKTVEVIANNSESIVAASPKQHWLHNSSTNVVSH
jgi:hypothetical protein